MQRPTTLLFVIAVAVLIFFLPSGCVATIGVLAWNIIKVVAILFAIIIIIQFFRKK